MTMSEVNSSHQCVCVSYTVNTLFHDVMLAYCNATLISTLIVYFSFQSSSSSSPMKSETMQMNPRLFLYDKNVCGCLNLMPQLCDASEHFTHEMTSPSQN